MQIVANANTPTYGFGFQLEFDPAYLEVVARPDNDAAEVPAPVGPLFQSAQRIKNAADVVGNKMQIDTVYTFFPPATAVQGIGTIASVSFKVLQEGSTQLNLLHPRLIALNADVAKDIPLTVVNPTLMLDVTDQAGSIVPLKTPEPVSSSSSLLIGIIGSIVAAVSLISLILAARRGRRKSVA